MNHSAFFAAIRPLFGGALTQDQVDGCEALLAACDRQPISFAAYIMATAFHETAATMQPISERGGQAYFWRMYDQQGTRPGIAKALGNTKPGDGALFHGRGYVQLTGRSNYAKASQMVGVDLVADPEKAKQPTIAAQIIVAGMLKGIFTGKSLHDFLPGDYAGARRIINGRDCADLIASYAFKFDAALSAAGWGVAPKPAAPPPSPAATKPAPATAPETGLFAALLAKLKGR